MRVTLALRRLATEIGIYAGRASPRRNYVSSQAFYSHVDEVVESMRAAGLGAEARAIHELLHERAWTTGNELMGELRECFAALLSAPSGLPAPAAGDLRRLAREIDRAQRSLAR